MSRARRSKPPATVISIMERAGFFAEDKDVAAEVRMTSIRPAICSGNGVILDFAGVVGATQSFIHALIAALIREDGPSALDLIEFRSCSPSLKAVIAIVVEYCQLDVGDDEADARNA